MSNETRNHVICEISGHGISLTPKNSGVVQFPIEYVTDDDSGESYWQVCESESPYPVNVYGDSFSHVAEMLEFTILSDWEEYVKVDPETLDKVARTSIRDNLMEMFTEKPVSENMFQLKNKMDSDIRTVSDAVSVLSSNDLTAAEKVFNIISDVASTLSSTPYRHLIGRVEHEISSLIHKAEESASSASKTLDIIDSNGTSLEGARLALEVRESEARMVSWAVKNFGFCVINILPELIRYSDIVSRRTGGRQ